MHPWARRTVKIVGGTLLTLVLLIAAVLIATQTSWFRDWARGFGEKQAARLLNGQLHIGRLDGNLWSGAMLTDVRITQDGREVVRVERVRVTYSVRQLLSRHWRFPEITLTRPSIVLIHDAAGWHIEKQRLHQLRRIQRVSRHRDFVGDSLDFFLGERALHDAVHKARPVRPKHPRHAHGEIVFGNIEERQFASAF